ncbi:MAG: hypothetical protein IKY91_06210, partial [Akkermansia sp.]|nr:hypothetical protein [Akkermansia sp.]
IEWHCSDANCVGEGQMGVRIGAYSSESHATGQGFESPMLQLKQETESEINLVRFLLFIDFQHLRKPRHCTLASDAAALPGAKCPQKAKKPKHA